MTTTCRCGGNAVWDSEAGGYICLQCGCKAWKCTCNPFASPSVKQTDEEDD